MITKGRTQSANIVDKRPTKISNNKTSKDNGKLATWLDAIPGNGSPEGKRTRPPSKKNTNRAGKGSKKNTKKYTTGGGF